MIYLKHNGIKTKIHINNYKALRKILGEYVPENDLANILHQLQFASLEERMSIFDKYITDTKRCEQLKVVFQLDPIKVSYSDAKENKLDLPEEYMGIYKMAEGLSYITNNEVYFDPQDLHSIETIDNFALRFRTTDGVALGDGGEYSNYAKRWNDKIQSFWSVASGVEAIERNSPEIDFDEIQRKIALCSMDATPNFILKVLKELEEMGECVVFKGKVKNVGKAIKQVRKEFSHIAIIGKNEENGESIKIKAIDGEGDFEMESPNNTKLMKEDIDDLREEI